MSWFSATPWFFQSPWMLFALFSLIVPLVIHLLSKSKGKLIPFGNIKFIQLSKPVRMNEIRLVERLLLLCRFLLLIISVLLLSKLYYDDRETNNNQEGNILVTKDWLNNANESQLNKLALKANTGVVFLLSNRNQRLTNETVLSWQKNKSRNPSNQSLLTPQQQNTWLLVNHYAKILPENVKITVYSTNRLSQFVGNKIHLPNNINWQILKLLTDKINASINTLQSKPLSVLIISDDANKSKLGYINAALSIIKNTKLKNLTFSFQTDDLWAYNPTMNPNNQIQERDYVDWIFYLSSKPIPESVMEEIERGTKLIAEENTVKDKSVIHIVQWSKEVIKLNFPQLLMSRLVEALLKDYQVQQLLTNEQIESQLGSYENVNSTSLKVVEAFKNPFVDKLLMILLVVIWSIERVLSETKNRKQSKGIKISSSSLNVNRGNDD